MPLFLEGIKSLISKYAPLQIISWVWQDALKPHASKIRWITFLQILSVLTNFSGFWVLYYYVKAIEANQNLSLFHWTFAPRITDFVNYCYKFSRGFIAWKQYAVLYFFQEVNPI